MFRKLLAYSAFALISLSYLYMASENMAVSVYANKKSYGRDCIFIDAMLNKHVYHFKGKGAAGFGIHGCPVFEKVRHARS